MKTKTTFRDTLLQLMAIAGIPAEHFDTTTLAQLALRLDALKGFTNKHGVHFAATLPKITKADADGIFRGDPWDYKAAPGEELPGMTSQEACEAERRNVPGYVGPTRQNSDLWRDGN